jgi:hypothetical protein
MADKAALDKAIRAAYDSWTTARDAFARLGQEVAKPTKSIETLKSKCEAVKKLVKENQTALANLKKANDALFKLAGEFSGTDFENANIVVNLIEIAHADMKKAVDQAADICK